MIGSSVPEPGVSVVVPVYKGLRFLREALESLKTQTFRDWECVCVDDGSKDGSGALADGIAREDPRIRVIHRPNGGTSVARNTALGVVRGKYVAFLDEDDLYHPRMLETLHAAAERFGADVAGCGFAGFDETARPDFRAEAPLADGWEEADRVRLREWVCDYYNGVPFEVWRNLYRREILEGHLFREGVRIEQDMLWHYTLLPRIGKYVRTSWVGYGWRRNSIGGALHPDPASEISLLRSSRTVAETLFAEMELSADQKRRLARSMALQLKWNVWGDLRHGLRLTRDESIRLRRGLRDLAACGIDIRDLLGGVRRIRWNLFLATGWTGWVRK